MLRLLFCALVIATALSALVAYSTLQSAAYALCEASHSTDYCYNELR